MAEKSAERCLAEDEQVKQSCQGDCHHCQWSPDPPDAPLRGVRFSAASLVAFLLPVVAAIAGGMICRQTVDRCTLGVVVGLLVGIAAAWIVNRVLCRETKLRSPSDAGN